MKQYKYIIGIDPGVHTGFAVWDRQDRQLITVTSGGIIVIQDEVYKLHGKATCLLRIEDARLRKWFGKLDAEQKKYGVAVREGAGSIKRDCQVWEEFALYRDIPFEMVAPKNNRTKMKAALFIHYTGWTQRTNTHARDAAWLCYGY